MPPEEREATSLRCNVFGAFNRKRKCRGGVGFLGVSTKNKGKAGGGDLLHQEVAQKRRRMHRIYRKGKSKGRLFAGAEIGKGVLRPTLSWGRTGTRGGCLIGY